MTEAAVDAAMGACPDQHISLGHWEPAIHRRDMRRVLEAAVPHLAAAPPTVIVQVADGGTVSEAEWNALGDRLKAAQQANIAAAVAAETVRCAQLAGDGAALITAERRRQVEEEGWTAAHDDKHDTAGLARAGACYALHAAGVRQLGAYAIGSGWPWPWSAADFKPDEDDPVRTLVKAGALIAAEIDRLLREARP